MESYDQKVWVKYGKGRAVEVSVPPECNVNGLIKVIKGELSVVLKDYDVSQISLHGPEEERKDGGEYKGGEEETAYEPDVLVSVILQGVVGQTPRKPILIRTTAPEAPRPSLINTLDVAAAALNIEELLAQIDMYWDHYYAHKLSPDGFSLYLKDRNSLATYVLAAASASAGSVGDVQMSKLSLTSVDVSTGSGLSIRYWTPDTNAMHAALSNRFGDNLPGIVSSLVQSLGKIRAMLFYLKDTAIGHVNINEITHIQPIFQIFLKELCNLCGWPERNVFDARAVSITASLPRKGDQSQRLICNGQLDVLSITGEWDPLFVKAEHTHLIAELKRPFDTKLMVGRSNGAAAQTMAQCEWLLQSIPPGRVVAACSTDMFALAPHLALKDERGHTVHLIGRRVCRTEEYVRLLLYLCLDHSGTSFATFKVDNSCGLNNVVASEEFDIQVAESPPPGPPQATTSMPGQMQDENKEPFGEMSTRSGGKYKRAVDEVCNTLYEDDDTTREQIEQLRRWDERFQGRRVLRESDMCNR